MKSTHLSLVAVGFISIFVLIAAWSKFFYPVEIIKVLDITVSILEVILIGCLFAFRKRPLMWIVSGSVFASWCGYALFWYAVKLPCSCMGEWLKIPTLFSLLLDVLFVMISYFMAYVFFASKKLLLSSAAVSLIFGVCGFFFAEWIYRNYILA